VSPEVDRQLDLIAERGEAGYFARKPRPLIFFWSILAAQAEVLAAFPRSGVGLTEVRPLE